MFTTDSGRVRSGAVALVATIALTASGCGQSTDAGNSPSAPSSDTTTSPTSPTSPASSAASDSAGLTTDDATKLVQRYISANHSIRAKKGAKDKSSSRSLRKVLTGPALQMAEDSIALTERTGRSFSKKLTSTVELPNDATYSVSVSSADTSPQQAVIIGTKKAGAAPDSLYLAERRSTSDPWLISFSTGDASKAMIPAGLGDPAGLETLSGKAKYRKITPTDVSERTAAALQTPKGVDATAFSHDKTFTTYQADTSGDAHRTVTVRNTPSNWVRAYRNASGGLIVLGSYRQVRENTMDPPYYTTPSKGDWERELYQGRYSAYTYTESFRFISGIQGNVKIKLLAAEWDYRDLKVKKYS